MRSLASRGDCPTQTLKVSNRGIISGRTSGRWQKPAPSRGGRQPHVCRDGEGDGPKHLARPGGAPAGKRMRVASSSSEPPDKSGESNTNSGGG